MCWQVPGEARSAGRCAVAAVERMLLGRMHKVANGRQVAEWTLYLEL